MILRPYQSEAIAGVQRVWQDHRDALLVMATGCHGRGERVLLHSGDVVESQEVAMGDCLMGPDGTERVVVKLRRGTGDLYRVTPVKGDPMVVTGDHLLTLVQTARAADSPFPSCRGGQVRDVRVDEWMSWSKSRKHVWKLFRAGHIDPPGWSEWGWTIKPYEIGILLGDGSLMGSPSVSTPDPEIISAVHDMAKRLGMRIRKSCEPSLADTYYFVGRGVGIPNLLTERLKRMGIWGHVAGNKRIPTDLLAVSAESRLELLAGLLDTDGHLSGSVFDFVSKSRQLADAVCFLSRSVGLAAYCSECVKGCQTGAVGTYYRVCISGDTDVIPTRIPRKQAGPRSQKKNVLRTGFTVEPVGQGEYFGWTVAGADNRYLMHDFTVTHNCGKTFTFCNLISAVHGRTLILAHRKELVEQAAAAVERVTGNVPAIEMGGQFSGEGRFGGSKVVCSTVQTMSRRMRKFDPRQFGLIIIDEAHHATASSYTRIIDYFRELNRDVRVLGVTATPDRADNLALGSVFDDVAYSYDIRDAVGDGWLVPVQQTIAEVEDLDYSNIDTTAGDLNLAQLDAVLRAEGVLNLMAQEIVRHARWRSTLVFCAKVDHAEAMAEIINRVRPGSAQWLCGKTPKDKRREMLRAHNAKEFQFLCNVGVLTEGYDDPGIELVAMARPTKSRTLYAQMVGRGTRPLPGVVEGKDSPEDRRDAIATSTKPHVEVLDFAGNAGRHKLVTTLDILGGEYPDEVVERAAEIAREGGDSRPVDDLLNDAEEELRREQEEARREAARRVQELSRKHVLVDGGFRKKSCDPFDLFDIEVPVENEYDRLTGTVASPAQIAKLEQFGVANPEQYSKRQATKLIGELIQRRNEGGCSVKQGKLLQKFGYDPADLSFKEAGELITAIKANGWRRVTA